MRLGQAGSCTGRGDIAGRLSRGREILRGMALAGTAATLAARDLRDSMQAVPPHLRATVLGRMQRSRPSNMLGLLHPAMMTMVGFCWLPEQGSNLRPTD